MNKKISIGILVVLAISLFFILVPRDNVTANLDYFAQCLVDRGAVMYGAEWCPHCQDEKRGFSDSWRIVSYVECPADPAKCLAQGIEGYPTWIIGTSTRLIGAQGIEKLSEITGCSVQLEKGEQ